MNNKECKHEFHVIRKKEEKVHKTRLWGEKYDVTKIDEEKIYLYCINCWKIINNLEIWEKK